MSTNQTIVERKSDCELVLSRSFDSPPALVFKAWTTSEYFMRWWTPKSMGMKMLSCEIDARIGGGYKIEFQHPAFEKPFTVFGKYADVVQNERLVWTNEETPDGAITTVTFTPHEGRTMLVLQELYPTKEAFDASAEGTETCMPEQFAQLDELLLS